MLFQRTKVYFVGHTMVHQRVSHTIVCPLIFTIDYVFVLCPQCLVKRILMTYEYLIFNIFKLLLLTCAFHRLINFYTTLDAKDKSIHYNQLIWWSAIRMWKRLFWRSKNKNLFVPTIFFEKIQRFYSSSWGNQ